MRPRRWVIDQRRVLLRFALGLAMIAGLVYWATPSLGNLRGANGLAMVAALVSSLVAFTLWFEAFYRSIRSVAPTTSRKAMVVPYLGGSFSRYVTPAGTLSGVAIGAYLAARWSDASGDRTLGALAVLEILMIGGSALAAATGLLITITVRGGKIDGLREAIVAISLLVGILLGGIVLVVVRSEWVVRLAMLPAGLARRTVSWIRPSAAHRFSREVLQPHLDSILRTAKIVAQDRRAAASVLLAGFLGWVAMGSALYWSAIAVGIPLDPWLAVAIVPVAGLAGVIPTPGGLGAIDGVLVALLLGAVGGEVTLIVAGTLVYRVVTYWVHLGLSGLGAVFGPASPESRPLAEDLT